MRQGRPSTAAYVKINVYIDCNRWNENSHCLLDCLFMTFIVHTSPALYGIRRRFIFPLLLPFRIIGNTAARYVIA